jgi:hypothetical protein
MLSLMQRQVCWRMLTYAGVCWRKLTYAVYQAMLSRMMSRQHATAAALHQLYADGC